MNYSMEQIVNLVESASWKSSLSLLISLASLILLAISFVSLRLLSKKLSLLQEEVEENFLKHSVDLNRNSVYCLQFNDKVSDILKNIGDTLNLHNETLVLINNKINNNEEQSQSRDQQLRKEFINGRASGSLPKKNGRSATGDSAPQKPKVKSSGQDGGLVHKGKKAVRKSNKNKPGRKG